MTRRVAAVLNLVCFFLGMLLILIGAMRTFPAGLVTVLLVVAALVVAWEGVRRRGWVRPAALAIAVALVVVALVLVVRDGVHLPGLLGIILIVVAVVLVKRVFSPRVHLASVTPPTRPALVYNPKSGGGKATTFHLADEAARRGIEAIELKPGDDLVELVRGAVGRGADGLMAAGGDGTQALVAAIAAEHDLPFACIPAGTRNHFALDLGVDRDDVVGALDAFVDGGERRVDLGEVNGRVFVNNVSLGLYAEAVQQEGYRDAKIRTLLDTVPMMLGPQGPASDHALSWTGPDGTTQQVGAVILVANNIYRLGRVVGSGTRPRMDQGVLGVAVMGGTDGEGRRHAMVAWAVPEFVVESDGDIPVGVDGEALKLPAPLVFRSRPGALRVRISRHHPGASPSVAMPMGLRDGVRRVLAVAGGADPMNL